MIFGLKTEAGSTFGIHLLWLEVTAQEAKHYEIRMQKN